MKKSLSLAIFLLSSSSFLHAKGGLEQFLGGPEQDLHLGITHAIKKQKFRVLDGFSGSPVLSDLKNQYGRQVTALGELIRKHSSIDTSSSEYLSASDEDDFDLSSSSDLNISLTNNIDLFVYNDAKKSIKLLKSQLSPVAKLQLKLNFASLPIAGAPVESVRYGIALKDASSPALGSFQTEFHKHDYHQFIEWRNYGKYLMDAANDLTNEGNSGKSTEYKKAAFRIYEEILPVGMEAFTLLRGKKLPARLYNARAGTSGELGGLLTTDELLEMGYYEAGNLGLILGQTEPALNFLLLSQKLAKANNIDRPYLPYLIAREWHNLGEKMKKPEYFRLAVVSYNEYFESNPKTINLDYYIRAADAALIAEQTDRESEDLRKTYLMKAEQWMRNVIDTLNVTKESDRLNLKGGFTNNVLILADRAYKDKNYPGALYFYEAILQNEAIVNQPGVSSSIQYYNAGTMAYLAKDYAKACLYLNRVNREDPSVAKDARIGQSIGIWLQEIAHVLPEVPSSSSVAGPSTSYES